ncbi:hypothetical protein GYMLUDRAFT_39027 [Collybiopsis luxurians FD-317 M1]|nr:hypothetical protein GYMLUDRAFT_39027 [Collybiopsis luxurians FD-317 M1]
MTEVSEASGSAAGSPRTLCNVCDTRYAIYTCPRCKIRTCSLPCSSSHKTATNCSGERDKVAFVNMKDYTWGTLMSDYTYLEEVGRKVGEWGAVIAKGSYTNHQNQISGRGHGIKGGRGTPRGRGGRGNQSNHRTKRDILKSQLEMHDVSLDLLPVGMARRQQNQSIWDFKNQTAYLTVELQLHPPRASTPTQHESPFTLLTHRNNVHTSLLSLVANHVKDRRNLELKREKGKGKQKAGDSDKQIDQASQNSAFPSWLLELVEEIPDCTTTPSWEEDSLMAPFDSFIRAPISPMALTISGTRPKVAYHRVIPTEPLLTALRNTHFVEFPTLEVWPQGEFSGVIADQHAEARAQHTSNGERGQQHQWLVYEQGDIVPGDDVERRAKRRRVELRAGKRAISGLLDGYGSGSESEQEGEEGQGAQNGLALLGGYADSDDGGKLLGEDSDDEGEIELSPEALLELMKNARGNSRFMDDARDDERVDWGDDDSERGGDESNH